MFSYPTGSGQFKPRGSNLNSVRVPWAGGLSSSRCLSQLLLLLPNHLCIHIYSDYSFNIHQSIAMHRLSEGQELKFKKVKKPVYNNITYSSLYPMISKKESQNNMSLSNKNMKKHIQPIFLFWLDKINGCWDAAEMLC